MKISYQHEVTTSFVLWFDNFLLSKGEAFKNLTSSFYYQNDSRFPDNKIYASPHKQWVTDSSIPGANIANGVYNDGVFIPRGSNGLKLDFENGRAILNSGFSSSANITGSFALKDFNIYVTDQNEEDLIIESNLKINSRFFRENTGIPPYDHVVPAIFISNEGSKNDPFAFGGEDKTTTYFKAAVIAENLYMLDGVLSIFNDSSRTIFSKIPFKDHPITEFGDLKPRSRRAVFKIRENVSLLGHNDWGQSGGPNGQKGGTMTVDINSSSPYFGNYNNFTLNWLAGGGSFSFSTSGNNLILNIPMVTGVGVDNLRNYPAVGTVRDWLNTQTGISAVFSSGVVPSKSGLQAYEPIGNYFHPEQPITQPIQDAEFYYNYKELAEETKQDYFLIESVSCSRMSDNLRKVVLDNLFVGFIDFEVAQTRFPRL
jgi:hypothetical protein